jgi:hypothetical protein
MKLYKVIIFCLLFFLCGIFAGNKLKQNEIERRSLELDEKDLFTNIDIEHILFNTPL